VTGVTEFGNEVLGVDPIDVGQGGAAEEVAIISGEGQGSDFTHNV